MLVTMKLTGVPIRMEDDTGSRETICIVSESTHLKLWAHSTAHKLRSSDEVHKKYTGQKV